MLGTPRGAEGIMVSKSTHSSCSLGTYTLVRGQGERSGGREGVLGLGGCVWRCVRGCILGVRVFECVLVDGRVHVLEDWVD